MPTHRFRPSHPVLSALASTATPTVVGAADETAALSDTPTGTPIIEDTFTASNGTGLGDRDPDLSANTTTTITVSATGGTFKLYSPSGNGTLNWNTSAATLAALLLSREGWTAADVVVSGGPGGTTPFTLTWTVDGPLAASPPTLTTDPALLTGGAGTADVADGPVYIWETVGDWDIESNTARLDDTTPGRYAAINALTADTRTAVDITWGHGGGDGTRWPGVVVRYDEDAPGLGLVFRPVGFTGTAVFGLFELDTDRELARFRTSTVAADIAATSTVEADCVGTRMTFRVDGTEIGTHTLQGADAADYLTGTRSGVYSNEQVTPGTATFDDFTVTPLPSDTGDAYLETDVAGVTRFFGFTPPAITLDGSFALVESLTVTFRHARTGAGLWRCQVGAIAPDGSVHYAEQAPAPVYATKDDVINVTVDPPWARLGNGDTFDAFTPTAWFVRVDSSTENPTDVFGIARLESVTLEVVWVPRPTVALDAVELDGANPVVAWTFDGDDDQDAYEVRAWLPATIAANPGIALGNLPYVYWSGKIHGKAARKHRLRKLLVPGTVYIFGVRCYRPNVVARPARSEWSILEAETPVSLSTTPTVVTAAGSGGGIDVTIGNYGPGTSVQLDRATDGAVFIPVLRQYPLQLDIATIDDDFGRADAATLGTAPTGGPWDEPDGGTSYAIVNMAAVVTGTGNAFLDAGTPDVTVTATVDVTGPPTALLARWDDTAGYVAATVTAGKVTLTIWDEDGSTVHHSVSATFDRPGDTVPVELACFADEYLVVVAGETVIRYLDGTVPAGIKTGELVGFGGIGVDGPHRVTAFSARPLGTAVTVYADVAAAQGVPVVYRAVVSRPGRGSARLVSPAGTSTELALDAPTWRLVDLDSGTSVEIDPESVTIARARPGQVDHTDAGTIVNFSGLRKPAYILRVRTLSKAEHDAMVTVLEATGVLVLSDNLGGTFLARHASQVDITPIVSEPVAGDPYPVRHHHMFTFTVQVV